MRELKYGTGELVVPVVGKPQLNNVVATPSPARMGEHIMSYDTIP